MWPSGRVWGNLCGTDRGCGCWYSTGEHYTHLASTLELENVFTEQYFRYLHWENSLGCRGVRQGTPSTVSSEENIRKWESKMPQTAKVFASMPDNMSLITQNLPHGGRRKLVQTSCSLTSAYVLWCTHMHICTHTHTHTHMHIPKM